MKEEHVTTYIPCKVHAEIKALAKREGRIMSAFLGLLLALGLKTWLAKKEKEGDEL